jgi:hypothetical protein
MGLMNTPANNEARARVVLIEDEWCHGYDAAYWDFTDTAASDFGFNCAGAEVVFRYAVPAARRDAAKTAADARCAALLRLGAVTVTVEERVI